jgi:hypothetical protein
LRKGVTMAVWVPANMRLMLVENFAVRCGRLAVSLVG